MLWEAEAVHQSAAVFSYGRPRSADTREGYVVFLVFRGALSRGHVNCGKNSASNHPPSAEYESIRPDTAGAPGPETHLDRALESNLFLVS